MKTIDITTRVSEELLAKARSNERMAFNGHIGTHFDVMNKEFPLDYLELEGLVFDVSHLPVDSEVTIADIDVELIHKGQFVAFCTNFIEKEGYGTQNYFGNHPQLSFDLIDLLLDKQIAIIGVDFAGVRRGAEHTKTDQLCANRGAFVVENLCNLSTILNGEKSASFRASTYPVNFSGQTGLPCRVVARIAD